jgi:hypothetical protein
MSPVLQPPGPLQLFNPFQSCLDAEASDEAAALPDLSLLQPVRDIVPATSPVMAAEIINAFAVPVIVKVCLSF